jgi:hypothetical protein
MTLDTDATAPNPTDTSPADHSPEPRAKVITRMLTAAEELRGCGLEVHAVPVGSDLIDCRGAVKQLAITNPHAPGWGRILITRERHTLTVKATWESWIPLRDDAGIQQLVKSITYVLNGPNHSPGKAGTQ